MRTIREEPRSETGLGKCPRNPFLDELAGMCFARRRSGPGGGVVDIGIKRLRLSPKFRYLV